MKRILPAFVLLLAVAVLTARLLFHFQLERRGPADAFPTDVVVRSGQSFHEVSALLENLRLVPDRRSFALWARWQKIDRLVYPGTYRFTEPLTPLDILERIRDGAIELIKVTIPEGLNASEIVGILSSAGLGSLEEYEKMLTDPKFLGSLEVPAESIEGYLYPDTYLFAPGTGASEVIRTLTKRFRDVFDSEMRGRAQALGLDVHQVVTLASVVEKETGKREERRVIASVFHNRLRIGMPLQSDPTVIYGIGEDFDGNLTRKHLETRTPYNTYTNGGLPPGPIASPGGDALRAVVDPAETDFLYFVSRNDGSHEFNRNLADHNRAVRRFQQAGR